MYIVIIGMGEVGRHLLRTMEHEGHDLVAVDASADAIQFVEDHHDVMTLVGYGASHDVLAKAQVERADLVVAVTDHDEVNLIAALAAKQLGAQRVIARERLIELSRTRLGDSSDRSIDVLISRLRRKLSSAGAPAPIVTVRGVGYMLNAPV